MSAGPDNIPDFALKLCRSVIAPVLQVIFTQNLTNQTLLLTGFQHANI